MKRTLAILYLFFHFISLMQAQQPAFYHLSTAEGLSDNNVYAAARDKNGILWIGTGEGLNSFDGNRITTFYKNEHKELPENSIEKIVIDGENNVWLRTNTPFITMLDKKRKFHRFAVGDTTDGTNVATIFLSSKGVFAIKNRKHYLLRKEKPVAFEQVSTPFDSLLNGSGFTIYENNDTVFFYRSGKLTVTHYGAMKKIFSFHLPGLNGVRNLDNNTLLAYNTDKAIFYRISIIENKIISIFDNIRDQNGNPIAPSLRNSARIDENRIAFTNYFSGLYIIDFLIQKATHYFHDPINPRTIGGNNTMNIKYDTSGYLLITTQTSGLHFYNLKQKQAFSKPYFMNDDREVFDGYIQSIVTDKEDNVWMGAQDRLIKWDRKKEKTTFIPIRLPDGTNISGRETIRVVETDSTGRLWVGTSRYGVYVLDKNLNTIGRITDSATGGKTALSSPFINAICPVGEGKMWVGTPRGVSIADAINYKVTSLKNHPVLGPLAAINCTAIWKDDNHGIWVGSYSGVWYYNNSTKKLINYNIKEGLENNTIEAINKDNLGNYYFATRGGLSILSTDGKIINYTRSNGLRNDRCEGLLKDEKGFIWIGNLNCIIRYDPANKKFAVFEDGYGFSHGGFRMRCSYISNKGEMFWGTDKGLVYFFPDQMIGSPLPLHPSIHSVQTDNNIFNFTGKDKISFPYNTSSFIFNFSSGELSGDKKNQFLCKLSGFDKQWIQPSVTGQAVYSKLPPGNYTFLVKASRDGITWHNAPYPVEIIIKKPWWQKAWFRLLCILFITGIIYALYRYYINRKNTREINKTVEYFANSSYEHSSVEDILWDISRNCISRLGFEDCVIYLADEEKKTLVQKAAYGPKSPKPFEIANPIEIPFGKGIVGYVAETGKALIVNDTTKDSRYIIDDESRLSEITVPIIHEEKVIGIIDSEHSKKHFFTKQHLQALQTIASLCSTKISRAMAMDAMKKSKMELMELNVKMAESKFLNLRLQMNPHFLFNSLSSIQHLIVSQQATRAYKYLTVFSNFLRSLLNYADKNFIQLDTELKILHMYIELESLRFDQSFTWEINAEESLSNDEVLVPSLMVQPFAENAIWHGLLHKEGDKKLSIRFSNSSDEYLTCIIEDNGIGRQKAEIIQKGKITAMVHESKGIGIIRERLALLQQKTGKPASLKIEDMYSNNEASGTKVIITIPYYNPEES